MAEQTVVRLFPDESHTPDGATSPHLRALEAILFGSTEPISEEELRSRLPEGSDITAWLAELEQLYSGRGVVLTRVAKGWAFRTAPDLAHLMTREIVEQRRLSRAALEMLAIIAYHQPVTRTEIEEIRGVATSKGTLDLLLEVGWIRIAGRRQVPGRPVTYATSSAFLDHFGLDRVTDLPGIDELAAAGLLEKNPSLAPEMSAAEAADESDDDDSELDRLYIDPDIEPESSS